MKAIMCTSQNIMIHKNCLRKLQCLHNNMQIKGVICILIFNLSPQIYVVQNLNEKYIYLCRLVGYSQEQN